VTEHLGDVYERLMYDEALRVYRDALAHQHRHRSDPPLEGQVTTVSAPPRLCGAP
jgi:hypothetical protein